MNAADRRGNTDVMAATIALPAPGSADLSILSIPSTGRA